MSLLRRIFLTRMGRDRTWASIIQGVLTGIGVFTFIAGILYLPSLGPTRMESILCLLLLAIFALLCGTLGQLVVVAERLEEQARRNTQSDTAGNQPGQ